MNNNEFLNELLNLEKLQVMQAEFAGTEQITLFVESTLAAAICPDCDQVSTRIHDLGAVQMIRDLSIGERRCYLSYQARRFDCEHCDKTFVERVDWKRPGVSYTLRYEKYIYQRACKEAVSQIAQDERGGAGHLRAKGKKTLAARGFPQVKLICFDEISLHRGHGKYVLVISAPELGLVLDVLPDRNKETLEKWLDERGKAWCEAVKVACSDMWDAYQTVAAKKLPNARRIVDRFHVMKNLNDALTKARRAIQKEADEDTKEILKGCRWLLVKNKENLKAEEQQKLDKMLAASPELKTCYEFKETFRDLFNQELDYQSAEERLLDWVACVEASSFRALQSFVKTLRNWWQQILNYFVGRHNNGFAEGVNLKIKMLNRRGYGYRNFNSFRLHILVAFDPISR